MEQHSRRKENESSGHGTAADGRQLLIGQLERYQPVNEQEQQDRQSILELLRKDKAVFLRSNLLHHMTASAWVTNHDRSRVLMAFHNIYQSWSWLGGHADGSTDLLATAIREVQEESGLQEVHAVTPEILSVEILTVDGHEKRGCYVPSHLHLNLTYLLEADDHAPLSSKPDENSAVRWFAPEEAIAHSAEPWFRERIYPKLNRKLQMF